MNKMVSMICRAYIKCVLKIRWAYFHVSPMYIKFSMDKSEFHFQHRVDGSIHSNYCLATTEQLEKDKQKYSSAVEYVTIRCDMCGQEHKCSVLESMLPCIPCTCGGTYEQV